MRTAMVVALLLTPAIRAQSDVPAYQSPYALALKHPASELLADLTADARGDPKAQSSIAFAEWNSSATQRRYGAWGPPLKTFAPPAELADKSAAWKRERLLAFAARYRGYSYQHHHLPDWEPPADWPWKEVGRGHNAKGVDCSNFTSFVYNVALGIRFTSDCGKQAEQRVAKAGSNTLPLERIERPAEYAECAKLFRPGDLLFVKNNEGRVSHVVLWVGELGKSSDDTPLILDSTGGNHKDHNGVAIPDGVQLRPFRPKSWYWTSLSHVHRVIADDVADDFEGAKVGAVPAGWRIASTGMGGRSAWSVKEDSTAPKGAKVLAQTAESPSAAFNLCVAEKAKFGDVEINVAFKAVSGAKDQGGGVVWRYQDANKYYIARFNPLEDNYRLYHFVAGKRTQIGSKEGIKLQDGAWHRLRVVMVGDAIRCSWNDKVELVVKDATIKQPGQVGLWTKADAQTSFDDFRAVAAK